MSGSGSWKSKGGSSFAFATSSFSGASSAFMCGSAARAARSLRSACDDTRARGAPCAMASPCVEAAPQKIRDASLDELVSIPYGERQKVRFRSPAWSFPRAAPAVALHGSPRGLVRALTRLAFAATLLVVAPSVLAAQNGTIKGVVTDTATGPVVGAVVTVYATVLLTQTNTRGAYEFRGVSPGSHTVRVRALGHTPATQTVTVAAGETVTADFAIGSNAVELARVQVLAGSRARHQAADELAVPVDVYTTEQITQ